MNLVLNFNCVFSKTKCSAHGGLIFSSCVAATMEISLRTDLLLKAADKARTAGEELGREAGELRRQMETAARGCPQPDRPLCATLDPSGLHLALRLDRVSKPKPKI